MGRILEEASNGEILILGVYLQVRVTWRKNFTPTENHRVCSSHFPPVAFKFTAVH